MKKIVLLLSLIILKLSILFAFDFDEKLYIKIPNKYGDYSYLSQKEVINTGYKLQYIKLSIKTIDKNFYEMKPGYKFYSAGDFENFYYYSKMKMYPYRFMLQTVNLSQMNTDSFLFDTQELLKDVTKSPVTLLQRLFLDKNFYDDDGNIIDEPQRVIGIFLIDSSHFKRLLPDGDFIKDFFICLYYNKDNLTDEQIISSLNIYGYPLPIAKYQKYSLYEDSVMKKLQQETQKAHEAENTLYENLTKELKEIRKEKKETNKREVKKIAKHEKIKIEKSDNISENITQKKKTKRIIDKIEEIKDTKKLESTSKSHKKKTEKKISKIKKSTLKKVKKNPQKKLVDQETKIKKKKPVKALKKEIKKEEHKPKNIIKKIVIINKAKKCRYPLEENIKILVSGVHFKKKKTYNISSISKYTHLEVEILDKSGKDTLSFIIPKGYMISGIYADSVFTLVTDIKNTPKINIEINKLPEFPIIFIDKSEISPIEWVGIEPIIKDIKKSVKQSENFAVFYIENEKIKGNFSEDISQSCENYIWDNIYPLATSAGIRMEHLYNLADIWNSSYYSKRFVPIVHLFLSRATLKSLIAMDDWELTKKKFKILESKFGKCKIVIHSKITKKDNIPLYKLGLPFRKIK